MWRPISKTDTGEAWAFARDYGTGLRGVVQAVTTARRWHPDLRDASGLTVRKCRRAFPTAEAAQAWCDKRAAS